MSFTIPCPISPLAAKIRIPGSKSITNRALLLAALAEGTSVLDNMLLSDDTWGFITALGVLGIVIEIDENSRSAKVVGSGGCFPVSSATIECHDAGTIARFLLAACANQVGEFKFDGSARLRQRPLFDLIHVLRQQGADISSGALPLIISNQRRLQGGPITIPSDVSSQFLSGLLMISPYFATDVLLTTADLVSEPYVKMTCAMMADFGVNVTHHQTFWHIHANQTYRARKYMIESDFSSASYFFAAAAVTAGTITVLNMKREASIQGDSAFLDVLEKMGCRVISDVEGIAVTGPAQLQGIEVDMHHISDTMMTLAAIAPFANTPTRIMNIGNTRVKESDRIAAMATNLRQLGIRVDEKETELTIYPGVPSAGVLHSYHDHRIAMACSLIGLKVPGVTIDDVNCVNKTFPEFFDVFLSLYSHNSR